MEGTGIHKLRKDQQRMIMRMILKFDKIILRVIYNNQANDSPDVPKHYGLNVPLSFIALIGLWPQYPGILKF